MKRVYSRNVLLPLICLSFFLFQTRLYGQTEKRLLHPAFTDKYLSHTLLPGGGVRIFWVSDQYEGSEIYVVKYTDISSGTNLDSIQSILVDVPESYNWNWPSFEYISLQLADGSTLLMNNTPGCDVAITGAVVKLKSDGEIEWFTDFDEDGFYAEVEKMVFVDQHRIGIETFEDSDEYILIDRQGQFLGFEKGSFYYDETLETTNGYVTRYENQLNILDTAFQIVRSFTLSQEIQKIDSHPDDKFIVQTSDSVYLLEDESILTPLLFPEGDYDVFWPVANEYWAASGSQQEVTRFDAGFTPLAVFPLSVGIDPVLGISIENEMIVGATYSNGMNVGMQLFKTDSAEVDFELDQDIAIQSISIPDSVVVEYLNEPFYGAGWIHHYDFIYVDVINHGPDTIFNLIIQDHATTHCYFCHSAFNRWYIDSVAIAPGMTSTISLGSYVPVCLYNEPGELCLTVLSPNDEADGNYLNDSQCQPFSILISAKDVLPPSPLVITPNPAMEEVYLDLSGLPMGDNQVTIFNMAGQLMDVLRMLPGENKIVVDGYQSGMYILRLLDSEGHYYIQRFVVQN